MDHHGRGPNGFELSGLATYEPQACIDVGLAEGRAIKSAARYHIPAHRVAAAPTQAVKKSAIPAAVTPSITKCVVLPISPSRDARTGINKLEEILLPVTYV